MPRQREDLSGREIGNLKVIELDRLKEVAGRLEDYWLCECQCQDKTRKIIRGNNLRRAINHPDEPVPGKTVSCGCLRRNNELRRDARMKVKKARRKKIAVMGGKANKEAHKKKRLNAGGNASIGGGKE